MQSCLRRIAAEPAATTGLSGITWGGFSTNYFLFTYEDTRDTFAIPYDIDILEQVFKVPAKGEAQEDYAARPLYNKSNKFWSAKVCARSHVNEGSSSPADVISCPPLQSVADLLEEVPAGEEKVGLVRKVAEVRALYDSLSETYQANKGEAGIPLA